MYRISQEIDFCYGHRLLNYAGKCRHLHGHNGRAVVVLESDRLDERGMVVDFSDVKRTLGAWIHEHLDHRMLLRGDDPALAQLRALGEPVFVMDENPTAENIAKLLYDQAAQSGFPVVEVSLWETRRSCATYRRPPA
jgi:6-pyruvoyltetrahydropterin/6-carboxytetrahydropterin synthase